MWFWSQLLINHLKNIPKHWLRNLERSLKISMWNGISITKNEKKSQVKILNMKKYILENFQCILQLYYSSCGGLFFIFYFNITMTFSWIHIFHFLCVTNILSSIQKSTMSPIFFKNSSIIFNKIITKVYCNMDTEKLKILMFDTILHFKFIYNPKNLQLW